MEEGVTRVVGWWDVNILLCVLIVNRGGGLMILV
jgi:hypothetical protein